MNRADKHPSVDVLIIGAGIAGLWSANVLSHAGYSVAVVDANGIGGEQTLASQGLIHGGIKYALGGFLTGASNAIAGMPQRWRDSLSGADVSVKLSGMEPVAEHYVMFSADSVRSRLSTFLAGQALRGDVRKLAEENRPAALEAFSGMVYELPDLVLDAVDAASALSNHNRFSIYKAAATLSPNSIVLDGVATTATAILCCAGSGNESLLQQSGVVDLPCQRRPLQQVIVRGENLPELFGHCITGIRRPEPRLTITSHTDDAGRNWYIGGQLATDGASLPADELIARATSELNECLPWIDLSAVRFETLAIDRAEPASDGLRPDQAAVEVRGNRIFAWPTKLSLAPDLGDRVLAAVRAMMKPSMTEAPDLPLPKAKLLGRPW